MSIVGYDWEDIVGETVRGGGGDRYSLGEALDVLGATVNPQANPAFAATIAHNAANNRPVMRKMPLVKVRQLTLGLGSTYIRPNATSTVSVTPQCFFRAEKLIATDNATTAGFGTMVTGVFVGDKNQLPVGNGSGQNGIPTFTYAQNSLGNGVEWDTCQPAITIAISITDLGVTSGGSTWTGALFGKTVKS